MAAYRRVLERLYTLLGREFGLVVVAVNQEWTGSGALARELVLAARSMSTETAVVPGIRKVVRGPVVRLDLDTADKSARSSPVDLVTLTPTDIQSAFAGRAIPSGTPLVVALVGVASSVVTRLGEDACVEKKDLAAAVSGGYLVLTYPPSSARSSHLDLCEQQEKAKTTRRSVAAANAKFLIGVEAIDDTHDVNYAIRVAPPPAIAVPVTIVPPTTTPVRTVRSDRWTKQLPSTPVPVAVLPARAWESLVQATVERELNKLLPLTTPELGDGLVVRLWPQLIETISQARDWNAVFTHQSVDPTPRANYEAFETLGDKVLSLSLVHYLFSSSSDIARTLDSNGLTDSHKEILSSERQAAMAVTMGLNQRGLIRTSVSVDNNMLEDVYEAFFGCLFTVANRAAAAANQGLPLCELLFKRVMHASFPELDPWAVPKDPQTTLDQVFIRMKWGHPIVSYNEDTRITTVRLTRDALAHLDTLGAPLNPDRPLVVGPRGTDKSSSTRAAAEMALTALKLGWGIDTRYVSLTVRKRLMQDEKYAVVQREAMKIAERMGFVDVYVARRAKNHNQLYAVMGVRPNDSEVQLHIYKYESPSSSTGGFDDESTAGLSTRVVAYISALRGFIAAAARATLS